MAHNASIEELAFSYHFRSRIGRAHALLNHYGSAAEVWRTLDEQGMQDSLRKAQQEAEWMDKHDINTYFVLDHNYPYRLRECPDAPLMLYGKGQMNVDSAHMLSIVGTRAASDRGREQTRRIVLDLVQLVPDVVIVSGLAYGIDVAAHKAAIEAGLSTIIVPGHGLDRIYPNLHRQVAIQALTNGGLLTEYMSGTEPFGGNFVARDRIIAGLSDAVLVVESRAKGGSLITAHMAQDYNRSVFAVPGRPSDDNARGCNMLIRDQHAALVESAEDIVNAMMWETRPREPLQTEIAELTEVLDETEQRLLYKLREFEDGLHINLIVVETGMPYTQISNTLMMMEIRGLVKSLPGGIYRALK